MTGHRKPPHAGQASSPFRRRRLSRRPFPLLVLFAAVTLLVASAFFATACGQTSDNTTTSLAASTTVAPSTETTAPSTSTTVGGSTFPVTVTDDNGKTVTVSAKPMRIVSTAPASTEILFALGVGDRVVGVTSLCDYPPEAAALPKVGDFQANTEAIMALSPDLVVGYSGNEEALAPVEAAGAAVIILNPATLDGIYADITMVGAATGATAEAAALVEKLKADVKQVADAATAKGQAPKVFYALDNTLWTAGPGSFVDELLQIVHATNVGAMQGEGPAQAYFQFAPEQLVAADPDVILLPNTAYKSIDEFVGDSRFAQLKAVKEKRVILIDDVIITRPGPRIAEGLKKLLEAVHPGAL
mgnify:CR=1 FL=1